MVDVLAPLASSSPDLPHHVSLLQYTTHHEALYSRHSQFRYRRCHQHRQKLCTSPLPMWSVKRVIRTSGNQAMSSKTGLKHEKDTEA